MDDYPTRADEVRETWKRKEKPVTPIERLRALEKEWRDELPYKGSAWEERHDIIEECADELATLIAELGQEVGADWSDWFETWAKARGMTMQLTEGGRFLCPDTALAQSAHEAGCMVSHMYYMELCRQEEQAKTSPAHTSEARDVARLDWLEKHGCWRFAGPSESDIRGPAYRWFDYDTDGHDYSATLREAIDAAMQGDAARNQESK